MLDQLLTQAQSHAAVAAGGAVLVLLVLIYIARKTRNATAGKIADKITPPVMFAGMLWSAEGVWVLTGPGYLDFATPLRAATFAVLEFVLLVAMLRAKDSMDRLGHTGAHGATAWLIASLIAFFGAVLGLVEAGIVAAVFRPIIPLMLTKLWWDGVLGDAERKPGSFKWTPRKLLIAVGALEADDRDVETVNRDRLINQMVTLHRRWSSAKNDRRRERLEAKLTRLSEKADEEIIAEVRKRRARSNWWTVTPLATHPVTQGLTHPVTREVTQPGRPRNATVQVPPTRRAKPPNSSYAPDEDPGTQAARAFLAGKYESRREAAAAHKVSDGTVRNRLKTIDPQTADTHPHNGNRPALEAR